MLHSPRKPTYSGANDRRGSSLIEVIIASSLLLMLLASVTLVFQTILAYHRRTDAQIDLERSTLLTLKTLSRECSESSWASFEIEPSSFVFATPRDASGTFLVGPDNKPAWASFVCYSLWADGTGQSLVKRVDSFVSPSDLVPEPLTFTPPRNIAWFASSALQPRVLQRDVEGFVVSREEIGDEDGTDVLKMELEASTGGSNSFSLEISTQVRPRN